MANFCKNLEAKRLDCVNDIHHSMHMFNALGFSNPEYTNNKLEKCRGYASELEKNCPDSNIAVIDWTILK